MKQVIQRIEQRVAALPQGLQAHINRVRDIARELAPYHEVDPERAALGALAHDVARAMPDAELMRRASTLDLPIGLVDREVPLLLHGPVGAEILQREDGLTQRTCMERSIGTLPPILRWTLWAKWYFWPTS